MRMTVSKWDHLTIEQHHMGILSHLDDRTKHVGRISISQFLLADSSTRLSLHMSFQLNLLVIIEFEIKRSRTKRVESMEVIPSSVEVVVMPSSLLTLWIHGVLALVKLTPHFWVS